MDPSVVDVASTSDQNSQQQLQDIQSYLATFNKEIGDGTASGNHGENVQQIYTTADGVVQPVQSFIQVNPQGQAASVLEQSTDVDGTQHSMGIDVTQTIQGIQTMPLADHQMIIGDPNNQTQVIQGIGGQSATIVASAGQPVISGDPDQEESVLLNTGNSYQTVTIVPTSEVNQSGEVSYVLIVSQPDDEKNADMSVFDFKEEKGASAIGAGIEAGMDEEEYLEGEEKKSAVAHIKFAAANRRPVTQLMCNYCNYTSPKRYLLTRHMKTHSEERPHKCNICDRGFKTVASLQNHINTHTGIKPHKCKECDSAFTTSGELVRHVRYKHTFEKPHKCPDCDYASVELSKLKRHIRSHTGERPYQCPHCSYASPDTYKLKRHLRIHTGEKPYECDICHARFTQSNSMKSHRLIHTGDKPVFQCELCPTTCGRKTDLKNHVLKLHTSDKPVSCKKCGKSFPDRYTFKMHVKTHEGEKCFRCELCPYAAMSQRHLETHILTHTGEKPYQCGECDMSFRQKQLLRRHKNLYHTPDYQPPAPKEKQHQCVECGKTFAHRGNMLRHMALHDPDNPLYQEINIMKVEEEERQAMEMEVMEEEQCSDGIPEGEQDDEHYVQPSTSARQVQVQLVNEDGQHAGQIYLQLENPDGTIPEGEPIQIGKEIKEYAGQMTSTEPGVGSIIKIENRRHVTIEDSSQTMEPQPQHQVMTMGIPEGEYASTSEQQANPQIIVTQEQTAGMIQRQADIDASFGFNNEEMQEEGIREQEEGNQ